MVNAPIAVRVNDGYLDQHVTRDASRLQFTKTASGGFAFGSVHLNLPRTAFRDLGAADRCWFYDARTGATLFEGFTQNPGGVDGPAGQGWDLGILGTRVLAGDGSQPLIYIDRELSHWETYSGPAAALSASVSVTNDPTITAPDPSTPQGELLQINPGQYVGTGSVVAINYHQLRKTAQTLGGIHMWIHSGKIDTGYKTDLTYGGTGGIGGVSIGDPAAISTAQWLYDAIAGANINTPPQWPDLLSILLSRTGGATNVADELTWSFFYDLAVVAARVYRDGTVVPPAEMVSAEYVRADWVVEDLLGRVLTSIDPVLSTVEATTYQIDQLTYIDGATPQRILEDLALYEPDMLWEFKHSTPRGYVFNYRRWPTTARYEISVADGYSAPGGEADQRNRVRVYWTDAAGKDQSVTVTSDTDLGGRWIDADDVQLPTGLGSVANANRIGAEILAAKARPPKAARAVVRRRIRDRLRGHDVWPWEIEPGYLVRVREEGLLLRLTEVLYDDEPTPQATLTLGEPTLSPEQRLARLQREVKRFGGRVA